MTKYNIWLPLILFAYFTVKELIFDDQIEWIENIGISVTLFVIYNLWEWTERPNKKNKDDS